MSVDIVMITTGSRPELLSQSLRSLKDNASDFNKYTLRVVIDDPSCSSCVPLPEKPGDPRRPTLILNDRSYGASAARNIGAGSVRKYRRGDYVLFLDDDVYMCPGWDAKLLELADHIGVNFIMSGYSHPFNHAEPRVMCLNFHLGAPLVISSVAMMMAWSTFDDVGPWDEPGGRGASEDYAMCMRARDRGYGFAVTEGQCIIHTGLRSNDGQEIVGYHELQNQNNALIQQYGLKNVRMAL